MNRNRLYGIVSGLLSADGSQLPTDVESERQGLLELAMEMTIMTAEPAKLTYSVEEWNSGILAARRFVRSVTVGMNDEHQEFREKILVAPRLPENGDEELDIDHGLCFAVARFMASMCCKIEYYEIHKNEALRICREYNTQTINGISTAMD